MPNVVFTLNVGSSSVKFALYDASGAHALSLRARGAASDVGKQIRFTLNRGGAAESSDLALTEGPPISTHEEALARILLWLGENVRGDDLAAIAHRVVHGGPDFTAPVLAGEEVLATLARYIPLAPSHQPFNIAGVRAAMDAYPDTSQVACFDTAFHQTMAWKERAFALPLSLYESGVRRYGFHGLSYEYIANMLPEHMGESANGKIVVAHLGHGASMCAIEKRASVATTMGMTALDGLVMARRCGALDPGVVLHLLMERNLTPQAVGEILYERSGLFGVSGFSDDMRELLAARGDDSQDPDKKRNRLGAVAAIELYVERAAREIGALAATLDGLDGLVFTGGVGENSAPIRALICNRLRWLGLELDSAANEAGGPKISRTGGKVSAWAFKTDEEIMLARHGWRLGATS